MAGGLPVYVAVDPQLAKGQVLSKLTESVEFYSSLYGPYPFNAVGAIVDSAKVVGYSLETQTKPNFPYVPDEATLVHEISHMWFGDSVTLTSVARHVAARRLCHVVRVDLERIPGQQIRRTVVQAAVQHARSVGPSSRSSASSQARTRCWSGSSSACWRVDTS